MSPSVFGEGGAITPLGAIIVIVNALLPAAPNNGARHKFLHLTRFGFVLATFAE